MVWPAWMIPWQRSISRQTGRQPGDLKARGRRGITGRLSDHDHGRNRVFTVTAPCIKKAYERRIIALEKLAKQSQ